jgi:hypothetical protein
VGNGCHIEQAVVEGMVLAPETIVEPFSVMRNKKL